MVILKIWEGYRFKIRMEFLRPVLAKIELICQQPVLPQLSGVHATARVWFDYEFPFVHRVSYSWGGDMVVYMISFLSVEVIHE